MLRIVAQHGEVLLDKGGNGAETTAPLLATAVLAKPDEISTNHGSIELASVAGFNVRLTGVGLVALLSPNALYLARGELHITQRSEPGQTPSAFFIATPCGRSLIQARDAWMRVEGNKTAVSVYEGAVFLGTPTPTGTAVRSGQSAHCVKGEAMTAPGPLLPPPQWSNAGELALIGDGSAPLLLPLHLQMTAPVQQVRVDLYTADNDVEVPLSSTLISATNPQLELSEPHVGRYIARAYALDARGAVSQESVPHPFLVTRVAGLGRDQTLQTVAGVMPRITGPKGLTWSVLLDGAAPSEGALRPGPHQLRIVVSGLSVDLPLMIAKGVTQAKSQPRDYQGDSNSVWIGPSTDSEETPAPPATMTAPPEVHAASSRPAEVSISHEAPGQEDVLFGGIGEVPFDGVRSPWARSYIGSRVESTMSGALRVAAGGRWTMRNGFGFDLSTSLVRAAIANVPAGQDSSGIGNINAAVRTPGLRGRHLALQGIVNVVAPISSSFLDRSVEQDAKYVNPTDGSTVLVPDVRPSGGGWRIEPALLIGVRVRAFTISTMQGLSLRVTPDVSASYAGGLLVQTEIVPMLRFVSFASWEVHYLGGVVNAAAQTPDMGGAVGGGFEALISAGNLGSLRLSLLGRAGIGEGGEALYGRGAVGFQFGYLFH